MQLNLEDKKTPAQLLLAYEQIFPGIHPEWIDGVIGINALPGFMAMSLHKSCVLSEGFSIAIMLRMEKGDGGLQRKFLFSI